MASAEIQLVYWQYHALKALQSLGSARSSEVAHLIGRTTQHTPKIIGALLKKGLIEIQYRPSANNGPGTYYGLNAAGRDVLRDDPHGPDPAPARTPYGDASAWLLTALLMNYPSRYLSVSKLALLAGVNHETAATRVSLWTKCSYLKAKPTTFGKKHVYALTWTGAVYAQTHQAHLNTREICLIAAFRSSSEFGNDLAARADLKLRNATEVLRWLANRGIVERSSSRAKRLGIGLAAHTYSLSTDGSRLLRDPRVRVVRQRQARTYRQATLDIHKALLTAYPQTINAATLASVTRLRRSMVLSILADQLNNGLISSRLVSAPSYTATRGSYFYRLTYEGLKDALRYHERASSPLAS